MIPAVPAAAETGLRIAAQDAGDLAHDGQQRPNWLESAKPTPAAELLIETLRHSDLDGLADGPDRAERVALLLERASEDPEAAEEAERLLSRSYVRLAQSLSWPAEGMEFGDKALVPRIPTARDLLRSAASARSLEDHVRSTLRVNRLYAQLRQAAIQAKADGDRRLLRQIEANMDRARSLPNSGRFVLVDIAGARLWMVEDGEPVDSMKVIVGKPETRTPLAASFVRSAILNPYWHVPVDLVRDLIAPNVLDGGFEYLEARGYQVVSDYGDDPAVIPPDEVDWKAVAEGKAKAWVRQLPGPANSMGELKIMFSNAGGIYLHDTPRKALFDEEQRALSAGCIRLEDARRLAGWLLGSEPERNSDTPEQAVPLPEPVPIYISYFTARPGENGEIAFAEDVYGLDGSRVEGATFAER